MLGYVWIALFLIAIIAKLVGKSTLSWWEVVLVPTLTVVGLLVFLVLLPLICFLIIGAFVAGAVWLIVG